jgi:hypothetical protein
MKLNIASLIAVAATLLLAAPLKAQSLQEVTAEGNKVFVEIVDEFAGTDDAFPQDEWEDVTNYSAEAGGWVVVSSPEEADFIFHVDVKKKMVFFSPRTWLTPSVRLKDGTVLWQGKTYIGDADLGNGFRATNAAIAKMLKKGFGKDLFPKIGRSDK